MFVVSTAKGSLDDGELVCFRVLFALHVRTPVSRETLGELVEIQVFQSPHDYIFDIFYKFFEKHQSFA